MPLSPPVLRCLLGVISCAVNDDELQFLPGLGLALQNKSNTCSVGARPALPPGFSMCGGSLLSPTFFSSFNAVSSLNGGLSQP